MSRLQFVACVTLTIVCAQISAPCAQAYGKYKVGITGEKVIIIWNKEKKRQHFIRQATFQGKADDFGFIVPTPTQPDFEEVDAVVYTKIENTFASRSGGGFGSGTGGKTNSTQNVEVLEQKIVGDYEVTAIKATDTTAMINWLRVHNYKVRDALRNWLNYYVDKGWIFTAFKYNKPKGVQDVQTTTIKLSFDTPAPIYPYRTPSDSWLPVNKQPMIVYFIAEGTAKGHYMFSTVPWQAETLAERDLDPGFIASLARDLIMKVEDFPKTSHLTALRHYRTRGTSFPDVIFSIADPKTKTESSDLFGPDAWRN